MRGVQHASRGLLLGAALLCLAGGQRAIAADSIDLDGLEYRLEQLKNKEHSLRRVLEQGQTDSERLHRRVVARGRAYYRASRGLPGGDFLEYAVKVERLRKGLLIDLARLEAIKMKRKSAGRSLTLLRERRAPLELERTAAGRARDALLSRGERERAFQMAFSASGARTDHTAVYSSGSQVAFEGRRFASLRGQLPFPLPGRAEVEIVKMPYAAGEGVILRAALATPARAVFSGRVAYADEYSKYGKTVIVDHGDDYFTVTSNLSRIEVKVGDDIPQSARLGLAGAEGGRSKIYFEIRRKDETLSPGEWLGI